MENKDYLAAFIFSGFAGIGCKIILSANARDSERSLLDNIPIASAISGVLLLRVANLLSDINCKRYLTTLTEDH